MLERLAAWFLNTYVAEYVGKVVTDQLSIGLLKGRRTVRWLYLTCQYEYLKAAWLATCTILILGSKWKFLRNYEMCLECPVRRLYLEGLINLAVSANLPGWLH